MGKYEKKKTRKKRRIWPWLVAVLALLIVFLMLFEPPEQPDANGVQPETTGTATSENASAGEGTTAQAPESVIVFPMSLEEGSLEIGSLYPFSGINPDCGNQAGENIAALELTNLSETYLTEARITVQLADGTQIPFYAADLPAGACAMVFSVENQSISADAICTNVTSEAVFDDTAALAADKLAVQTEGTLITLTNISGQDVSEIVVYCRNTLGEAYFGGVTYQYTINNLAANETATVDAVDCILGMAQVVRIAVGE